MALILDADAIIKLNRAGVLESVVSQNECIVTGEVYGEVVAEGLAAGHQDASEIEAVLTGRVAIRVNHTEAGSFSSLGRLGLGEASILDLLDEWQSRESDSSRKDLQEDLVISDDRGFRRYLAELGIRYLTTVGLVVMMYRDGAWNKETARDAMERLRPMVRELDYEQGLESLEEA